MFKKIWKSIGARVWAIVTAATLTLLCVVSVVSTSVYDFYELLNTVMPGGGPRAIFADGTEAVYRTDYTSKKEVYDAAREMNREICAEGMVLLKNKNNALPVKTPKSDKSVKENPKISIFGKNSVNLAYGGSGSGGGNTTNAVNLYKALAQSGYDCNPVLESFYKDTKKSGAERKGNSKDLDSGDTVILSTAETPISSYTADVTASYAKYNDAAIVVFTRIGGEGFDMPRQMVGATGYRNKDDHFLQLDANEENLLVSVCNAGFKKVIVLINSGQPTELGFLEEGNVYVTQKGYKIDPSKIDGAIWMGFPGETEEQFSELAEFVNDIKFERLGCFAYSAEEDTPAAEMPDQVDEGERQRRADIITGEQEIRMGEYYAGMVGNTYEVVCEGFDRYSDMYFGRSMHFAPEIDGMIYFKSTKEKRPVIGDFINVKITDVLENNLLGEQV